MDWEPGQIELNDYDLYGRLIGEFSGSTVTCTSESLKNELQDALDSGKSRFQLRIKHKGFQTDHDGISDGWRHITIYMNIEYVYK